MEIKMEVLTNIRRLESLEIVLGMAFVCNLRVLYHQCAYKSKEETVENAPDVTFLIKSVTVVGTYFLVVICAFWVMSVILWSKKYQWVNCNKVPLYVKKCTFLLYDPAIPLLSIYLEKMKTLL